MNQKEISELRRRFRPDKCAVSRIYGCFVNSAGEIVSYLDESLGTMPQEEAEKYLGFLKKTLSGTQGKNLIDIVFSTAQVADSPEHRLLRALRDSALGDSEARETFYRTVIQSLDMEQSYLILLAHDAYDVPHRGKDDQALEDASDTVFSYLLCCICPVKDRKAELGYFPGENEFHSCAGQVVTPPELGFLFPAFDNRAANLYNALFYARKADELHQEFIDGIFHTEPPMSAAEQRESFQTVLSDTLGEACGMEVVQAVHQQLRESIEAHKQSHDPEPLAVSARQVGDMLAQCGVEEQTVAAFRTRCEETFGGAALNPANLIDSGRFTVTTPDASVQVDPACSYQVELRVIDGRRYLLIPADGDVAVNGLALAAGVPGPSETQTD